MKRIWMAAMRPRIGTARLADKPVVIKGVGTWGSLTNYPKA